MALSDPFQECFSGVPVMSSCRRLPEWFKIKLPMGSEAAGMRRRLNSLSLHTVCESARCPNQGECWGAGTATIMIMGDVCTRGCRFCNVATGRPAEPPDPGEPERVAAAVRDAGLRYAVLTSVDRDDLPDAGASHFAGTIRAVKALDASILVEALIPDYRGARLEQVVAAGVDVLGHNVEVVRRLTPRARDRRASWDNSIGVLVEAVSLGKARDTGMMVKTSLMVGIGETDEEVVDAIHELAGAGVGILTIGQYLQPTSRHLPVERFVTPDTFDVYRQVAEDAGIMFVASGPLVRSSYRAAELFAASRLGADNRH